MVVGSKATINTLVGAAAAVVIAARAKDFKHVPRALLDEDGTINSSVKIWTTAFAIYQYEKMCAAILRRLGVDRMPSTLAALLSLFAILRTIQKVAGKEVAGELFALLAPGVNFLGKWMGICLAPPLVSLDASFAASPKYGGGVRANAVALLAVGWAAAHATAGAVASVLVPAGKAISAPPTSAAAAASVTKTTPHGDTTRAMLPVDEAIGRAWVIVGACSHLGVACSPMLPPASHWPIGMLAQASATIGGFAVCKLLPDAVQRVLHPLVTCAVTSNLSSRVVGSTAQYFDAGSGVGDYLFQWLPAALTSLGVRMYNTKGLWLDDARDFKCVPATCATAGCMSLASAAMLAVAPQSRPSAPYLSLLLLRRSVMSALGIQGSKTAGPECDAKLAAVPDNASAAATHCKRTHSVETLEPTVASAAKSSSQASAAPSRPQIADPYADILLEETVQGVEEGHTRAKILFSQGSVDDAVRWLSKSLWIVEFRRPPHVTPHMHSVLYSNRAFIFVAMRQWDEVEKDCSVALALDPNNRMATYRRAIARYELGKDVSALHDIEEVISLVTDPRSKAELAMLKDKIIARS